MEVWGTHTVARDRQGIRDLLPDGLSLDKWSRLSGVVTAVEDIEKAMEIARKENVIFTTSEIAMRTRHQEKSLLS